MSGDVQPRKRKDKKKKKDEEINDDVNIHVHKDGGTGGNICSKIVFFFLFSTLIFLIGLIIKENQGLNEIESIEEESRFSQIFEGWIEKKTDAEHDDKDDYLPELDHDEDDHTEEDEDGGYGSEEDNHLDSETDEVEESHETEDDELEEDEDSAARSEEDETAEETEEEEEDVPDSEEEEQQTEEVSEERVEDDSEEDKDDSETVEKSEERSEEEDEETETVSKEDNDNDDAKESSEDDENLGKEEVQSIQEENEKQTPPVDVESEFITDNQEQGQQGESKEPSMTATKIGVGIALMAVAYNVFLRKRQSDMPVKAVTRVAEEKEPTPDLSRRNTIIPPPSLQEIEPDLPEVEFDGEEYSGDEEYSDEENLSEHRSPREEYQELRTTYSRSLSPEGDFEVKDKHLEEEVLEDEMEELEPEEEFEEEEVEEESDQYDDDDEELLKRLEVKYGKLGREVNVGDEIQSESDGEDYEHSNFTNKDDDNIRADIDAANEQLQKNAASANKLFDALLDKYPLSPRVLYGKAMALDILAEKHQSNDILTKALHFYTKALDVPNVPDALFLHIAERFIGRARFIGQYKKAIGAHWRLIERFPENATHLNNLAVTYLTINMLEEARSVLKKTLAKWPEDGFAMVHYGFVLKMADNNLEGSVEYLDKGLKTKAPGVIDGRFFLYLGDSLIRLNRIDKANKIHEEGVKQKVFRSKYQRSLYNVPRLTAKPWWQQEDLPAYQEFFATLKNNWKKIKSEGLSALNERGFYEDEAENLKDKGTWKQLELFARGHKSKKNCEKAPVTCGIVDRFSDASGCRRGQTKFSVMHPGTHVWPHCGPTNCRLRVHLGLKVPSGTFIRVGEQTRSWKEGDLIIFDDSFEHEVWHNGTEFRLVLIVDVWHPDLTPTEKKTLTSI